MRSLIALSIETQTEFSKQEKELYVVAYKNATSPKRLAWKHYQNLINYTQGNKHCLAD